MPDLAELLRDPAQAASLSVGERKRLVRQLVAVLLLLNEEPTHDGVDRLLTAKETAALLGMSLRWVETNKDGELAGCRVKLGGKAQGNLRFSEMALLQLIARRRGA